MKTFLERLLFTLLVPFLVNCQLDAHLQSSLSIPSLATPPLPLAKSSVYSGESISLQTLFATDEYTNYVISSPDGYYDSASDSLVIPKNLSSKTTELILTSADGETKKVTVNILGLDESFVMETPQTYGDQNYPTSGTKLSDGTLLIGTIIVDSAGGWEWTVVQRSSDNGITWNVADHYRPYNEGEAHILAMSSHLNSAYSCGYQWDSDNYDAIHWYVRRSTDSGLTWTSADVDTELDIESLCQSTATSPSTGYVYAAGYDSRGPGNTNRWVLKESKDQGQTWSIIYTQDVNTYNAQILHVRVAPDNTIWFIAQNASGKAVLYKGTFATSWSFADMNVDLGNVATSNYQGYGELQIINNTTAYLSSNFGSYSWNIKRTTDGGVTWAEIYNYGSMSTKVGEVEVLGDGTIVSIGTYYPPGWPAPNPEIKIVRSTDGGNTWSTSTLKSGSYVNGCLLFPGTGNGVHAIASFYYYALNFYSTDSGATWSERDFIAYTEKFYNEITKLLVLPSGGYLSVGWLSSLSKSNDNNPWFTGISSDKGKTWSTADLFVDPTRTFSTVDAAYDNLGNIYVLGKSESSALVRKSSDGGQTWTYVEQYTHPTYPSQPFQWSTNGRLVADQNNNLYYGAFYGYSSNGFVEIRKGSSGGTTWNTVSTFPQNTSNTIFGMDDFKVDKNNVLWLSGRESNPASERILYKSVDGGVTWNEVRRESNTTSNPYEEIAFDSNGNIYLRQQTRIQKSVDGGSTWTTIMDSTYAPKSLLITTNNKIFVLTSDDKILKLGNDGSWLLINDQVPLITAQGHNYIYSYEYSSVALYQLDSDTIGVQTHYAEAKVGYVDFIKTIKISD
ncbi:sialidase family protein [Bdellovibrio sp. BCCA]|uniref:sialidase family protein n=1 Tax=Bdellovibrio sp. BCCA TaxID=3136281 RepID=UPI0030F26AEA